MDADKPIASRTAHWSKDYVEHLRAVHFALISVCVVLILLSLSRNRTEVEMAQAQNRQIEELLNDFHASWFNDYVAVLASNAKGRNVSKASLTFQLQPIGADTLQFQHRESPNSSQVETVPVRFDSDNWIITRPSNAPKTDPIMRDFESRLLMGDFDSRLPPELSHKPINIHEFHVLWDALIGGDWQVNVPTRLSNSGYYDLEVYSLRPTEQVKIEFVHTGKPPEMTMFPREWTDLEKRYLVRQGFKENSKFAYAGKYRERRFKVNIILPVTATDSFPFDGQGALIAHTKPEWGWYHGTFDESFQQLSRIVKNYDTLSLKTIDDILASERERTGETFDAIGLKLPAEDIVRFGILMVLCVQAYLWVHLREKSSKLQDDDEGWEVAWIGVYQSRYARALMFASTCLLPFFAALVLGRKGLEVSSFSVNRMSLPYWLLLTVGSSLALGLGLVTWRQLPNVHKARTAFILEKTSSTK
jgi:hypothetical protein